MNKKILLITILTTLAFFVGCNKVNPNVNQEVIDIDEDTKEIEIVDEEIEENKKLELGLKFNGYIERVLYDNQYIDEYDSYYILEDSLFRFDFGNPGEDPLDPLGRPHIIKAEMRKIDLNSINEDLNSGNWTKLDIEGVSLVPEVGGVVDYKIVNDNKVYKLLSDGSLKEINAYSDVYNNQYYKEYINPKIDAITLENENDIGIINVEEDRYFELKNKDKIEGLDGNEFNIFSLEENQIYIFALEDNRVYIYFEKLVGNEWETVIGYIENNKFYNLFEDEDFTVRNLESGILVNDGVIKNNNKILFAGIIDNVNGIWNYDVENKKLSLQLELEEGNMFDGMNISPNKESLIIKMYNTEKGNIDRLARINENLEIEEVIDMIDQDRYIIANKFSSDGKLIYTKYLDADGKKVIYKIYEVNN